MATSVFAGTNKVFDTLYQYDGMGRLTDLTHVSGDKVFADYDFGWDIANRITGFDFTYLGDKDEKSAEYGYDKTSQLVSADYNAFQPNESYDYDANGNRKKFETGANNQLTSDGAFRYTYDDEGNRIEKAAIANNSKTVYQWDHRNRLVNVVMPKETVGYVYDHRNRLVKRNDEFFVHDEWQIVASLKNGKIAHRYLWGASQDELIATNDQFTLCDHLGSVRDIVNADGKITGHREYNAFRKVIRNTGKAECAFGYTGKMFDVVTGLQWNINRWYDAEIGRWCSEDPIGFNGKDSNLFRCCGNSPVLNIDPNGLVTDKFKFLGFNVTNNFSYTYEGKTYTNNLNQLTSSGTSVPLDWKIANCYTVFGIVVDAEKDPVSGCWSPRFTVLGFCVIIRRPNNSTVVYGTSPFSTTFTNMDIWNAWYGRQASILGVTTFAGYLNAINNHELNHYNTREDAVPIIVNGLASTEIYRFMTKAQAISYGNKAKAEGDRLWTDAGVHSGSFDRAPRQLPSYSNPHSVPFTGTFVKPFPCP